jgi:hypothetical protein
MSVAACRAARKEPDKATTRPPDATASESRTTAAATLNARDVLALYEGPRYAYELSIERCARPPEQTFRGNPECPINIRLILGGKAVDSVALPETACGPPRPTKVDRTFGADPEASAWITGTEACQVGVAARLVDLTLETSALLVTQRIGWDHLLRRHALYVADKGKLREVWSADEGPSSSSLTAVSVLPLTRPSSHDVAFIAVHHSDDEIAERLEARRLRWDGPAARIIESPMPDQESPLHLMYVGPFRTAAAARAARSRFGLECFRLYDVLPTKLVPGLLRGQFVLGVVFASREPATAMRKDAERCPGAPESRLVEYVPRVEYKIRE